MRGESGSEGEEEKSLETWRDENHQKHGYCCFVQFCGCDLKT